MLKKLKKNQKGFTLVEIIVVLIILAILAAAAIPTMLGFVEDARGKTEVANARAAYVAAQTIATQEFAKGTASTAIPATITPATVQALTGDLDPTPTAITATVDTHGKSNKAGLYRRQNRHYHPRYTRSNFLILKQRLFFI